MSDQWIDLDDNALMGVFVQGEDKVRVFFDLDSLIDQFTPTLDQLEAEAESAMDDAMVSGARLVLEGIRQSANALRLDATFNRDN